MMGAGVSGIPTSLNLISGGKVGWARNLISVEEGKCVYVSGGGGIIQKFENGRENTL